MTGVTVLLIIVVVIYIWTDGDWRTDAQLELCQENCVSSDRLTGPTRMLSTRPHPWKIAEFPTKQEGFCQLGCQIFYTEVPKNTTCKRLCDYFYRYQVSSGYNDLAEEAKLECRDGCEIALQVCQAGYFCTLGNMLPCPAGTYREPVTDVSVLALEQARECTPCPFGRYRSTNKGKSADECSKCPIGTYANVTGSVKVSDCQRCPAGQNAEEEGQRLCKCITADSCESTIDGIEVFSNGVDYYRESIPFIGRW
mmetsp:Transcript_25564/g.42857  ORF Transcript_25564/g.42857 Transcript_25564/m.42857 type:complete len:253 (-) Transcript_25564:2398-3156(-)|eukprot:CAMPEP_0174966170 /NCGR_PEP_ID=MMETSP0004_2-20121128/6838_1 /TAXON_ID=420556 /ORGANISM="Ochromonas sp., Strain CCMP1393" /LENGTH=252 /DNA_ID=CAMNT_0016215079 /DNA_START=1 /DNA_END=759 /DNA_ORIENTATION=-